VIVPESYITFCEWAGIPLYPWQREAFGEATRREGGRFVHRLAGVSVPRGNGKTHAAAGVGLWRLVAGPPGQDVMTAALDVEGAKVMVRTAHRIVKASAALSAAGIELATDGLSVEATGSRWTVTSREHTSARGRHPDLILYDEIGWARDDELFASLLAGQASCEDPLTLVTSTVGRRQSGPLWHVKTLAGTGDAFWWHSSENLSPRVTAKFIERQRKVLLPGQFAREHQNTWVDGADAFTSAAEVDEATTGTEQHKGRRDVASVVFVDIGTVHDPSVIALGYAEAGQTHIARLITFQGSREQPVQIVDVEKAIRDLCAEWRVTKVRVESWQGVSSVQSLQRVGVPVELFHPTAKAHSEEWPILAQRLSGRTLVVFPHERLREELLNLIYEVGPAGVKVIDRGKVHQDHAVSVRGVCAMLHDRPELEWRTAHRGVFTLERVPWQGTAPNGNTWREGKPWCGIFDSLVEWDAKGRPLSPAPRYVDGVRQEFTEEDFERPVPPRKRPAVVRWG